MKWLGKIGVKLIPVALCYLPVAGSYAVIASAAGMHNAEIIAMSVFVLAGAAQLAAVPLIADGYGALYIGFITLLINFRHIALSATLSPVLRNFSIPQIAVFSYGLTDEAFAVHALDIQRKSFSKRVAIAVNVGTHFIWVAVTIAGCYAGYFILQNLQFIRLDIALPAMFLSIAALFLKSALAQFSLRAALYYAAIIIATVALTAILIFYELRALAFFAPALCVVGFVYIAGVHNPRAQHD